MNVYEFRKEFIEDIKSTAAVYGDGSSYTFLNSYTSYLVDAEVLIDFNHSFYIGTGKNNRKIRVDGYIFDEFDDTMNLIIADYYGQDNEENLKRLDAVQIFNRLTYFIEEVYGPKLHKQIEISTPCADLVDILRLYKTRIRKFKLFLLTDKFMSDRITNLDSTYIDDKIVEHHIWDIDRLFKIYYSDIGRASIEIDFTEYTDKGLPFIEATSANTEDFKCYLCIIPGKVLAEVYDKFGSQLLEGNVRSFLSTKVAVNKKIRETILKSPESFFAYNNGISATATSIRISEIHDMKYIEYIKDFQIINGGQTTASLSNARHKDKVSLEEIYVQMKLTEIESSYESVDELIRNISKSSNSQNKVSDADFFSTHPFHIRMEQISRRLFARAIGGAQYETRWFYERARGQFVQAQMRMTKAERNKFLIQNPKNQLITKTDFAKARNSWDGYPQTVSKGAQTNFLNFAEKIDEAWVNTNTTFNDKYYQDTVALIILFKYTESLVSQQPWYEKGYRANIVTYSLALFRRLVNEQFINKEVDLQMIWNRQTVPEQISNELIKVTKLVFETITDPKRETINVTQWCKRDACWKSVLKNKIELSNDMQKVLIDKSELKYEIREAKSDQKFMSGVEAQTKVIDYGANNWDKVLKFIFSKRLSTPDGLAALKIATQIPYKIPNPSQSKTLLDILNIALSEGFKL